MAKVPISLSLFHLDAFHFYVSIQDFDVPEFVNNSQTIKALMQFQSNKISNKSAWCILYNGGPIKFSIKMSY